MAVKWNADRNEKLLVLLLPHIKIKTVSHQLATEWAGKYADEEFKPTARAIERHVETVIARVVSNTGGAKGGTPQKSTPTTPKTPKATLKRPFGEMSATPVKKSRGSAKLAKKEESPDVEVIDDDDSEIDFKNIVLRQTPSRQSKVNVKYEVGEGEDDTDMGSMEVSPKTTNKVQRGGKVKHNILPASGDVDELADESVAFSIARSKKHPKSATVEDYVSESGTSEFDPLA